MKSVELIEVTEENLNNSFGTEDSTEEEVIEFDQLLRNYLEKYIEMVNQKDYSILEKYIYSGRKVKEGYSVEQQMKNQANNDKVVCQSLKECSVDEVIWIDDKTCQIKTSETYDAVYRKTVKEMKNESNSNTWEFCSQYIDEEVGENAVYQVSETVYQNSWYELKKTKKGEWKFYRFVEAVEQVQEAYGIE